MTMRGGAGSRMMLENPTWTEIRGFYHASLAIAAFVALFSVRYCLGCDRPGMMHAIAK